MPLDADQYDVLTFDCYGTLVDRASGISTALQPILREHDMDVDENERVLFIFGLFYLR